MWIMATAEQLLQAFDDVISDGVRRGMLHNEAQDDRLDGRTVTVNGRRLVNFGSCSYLGLETHPAMKAAVIDATERWHPVLVVAGIPVRARVPPRRADAVHPVRPAHPDHGKYHDGARGDHAHPDRAR